MGDQSSLDKTRPLSVPHLVWLSIVLPIAFTGLVGLSKSEIAQKLKELLSHDNRDVVVAMNRSNWVELINVDLGTNIRLDLTQPAFPPLTINPNGELVAYIAGDSLETMNTETGEMVVIETLTDPNLTFSSPYFIDDTHLAVLISNANERPRQNTVSSISIINIEDNSSRTQELAVMDSSYPGYFIEGIKVVNGRWLLSIASSDASSRLLVVTDAAGNQIFATEITGNIPQTRISPDGRYVTMYTSTDNNARFVAFDINTGDSLEFPDISQAIPWIGAAATGMEFIDNETIFIAATPTLITTSVYPGTASTTPLFITVNLRTREITHVDMGELGGFDDPIRVLPSGS